MILIVNSMPSQEITMEKLKFEIYQTSQHWIIKFIRNYLHPNDEVSLGHIKTELSLIPRAIDLKFILLNPNKPVGANQINKNQYTEQ